MQDGLHLGLAAWIHRLRNTGDFVAYPVAPVALALADLSTAESVREVAKAAELSRFVNFIPRQGQLADPLSGSKLLWQVHWDVLREMDFATEPWTDAERGQYTAARSVLYAADGSGGWTPSPQYHVYLEFRHAYQDLVDSGADPDDVREAMVDWFVRGNKQVVEDALEIILRLSRRSSQDRAQSELELLNENPPGVGLRYFGDTTFAPTYFAPLSAVARQTWMEARVSFADLDRAVGDDPSVSGRWMAYRAGRTGQVAFDYVVVTCIRPWFSPSLYEADDWKLSRDGAMVSTGNGTDGTLPAYVDAIYLVSVTGVTTESTTAPSLPVPPRGEFRPILHPIVVSDTGVKLPPYPWPRLAAPSAAAIEPRVARTVGRVPLVIGSVSVADAPLPRPPMRAASLLRTEIEGFRVMDVGMVRRLSRLSLDRRFAVAQLILGGKTGSSPAVASTPQETETYVVGFGCTKVPFAPNPNKSYRW